jgi:hypothetical protein
MRVLPVLAEHFFVSALLSSISNAHRRNVFCLQRIGCYKEGVSHLKVRLVLPYISDIPSMPQKPGKYLCGMISTVIEI